MMKNVMLTVATLSVLAAPAMAQTATVSATRTETYVAAKPTDVLGSNLIGLNVTNSGNETIGEIKDVLLSNGALAGYIVSVGGFLGMGERHVIVSPSAVKVNYSENDKKWSASMAATKDELKAAPEFTYEGRWKK